MKVKYFALPTIALALGIAIYFVWRNYLFYTNETKASEALRALVRAEAEFRAEDRDGNGLKDFWTADVAGLYYIKSKSDGVAIQLINQQIAEADANTLNPLVSSPIPYHGYLFAALDVDNEAEPPEPYRKETDKASGKVHNMARFGFVAYPERFGRTGRYTFIINENNTIFRIPAEGSHLRAWPKNITDVP